MRDVEAQRDEWKARAEAAEAMLRRVLDEDLPMVSACTEDGTTVTGPWTCACGAVASEVTQSFRDVLIDHHPDCLRAVVRAAIKKARTP